MTDPALAAAGWDLVGRVLLLLGGVSWLLAIAAIFDVVRRGASYVWILVIVIFPLVGSLAYLVVERLLGAGAEPTSPRAAARRTAREQLAELTAQASHWRGPHIVAEMGQCLLQLERWPEAEQHLAEAVAALPGDREVRYDLARALAAQGKLTAAIPQLERVLAEAPDHDFGNAALLHAGCLDETGARDRAADALEELLQRHEFIEARVRLARLLLDRDQPERARRLLDEVAAEAAALPRFHRREQRSWLAAARRLAHGGSRLPPVALAARRRRRRLLIAVAVIAATLLAVTAVLGAAGALRRRERGAAPNTVRFVEPPGGLAATGRGPAAQTVSGAPLSAGPSARIRSTACCAHRSGVG